MSERPAWLKKKQTRGRSGVQEKRLAGEFCGRVTINSGATFGENDVENNVLTIEAKTTSKMSYQLKYSDLVNCEKKDLSKVPVMCIYFEGPDREYIVIKKEDFIMLTEGNNGIK